MSRRPARPLLVLAWLLVVVGAAGVTWLVIDSTGREVFGETGAGGLPAVADPEPSTPRSTPAPTTAAPQPAGRSEVRSWQGRAGTVTAGCRSSAIALRSASPADGWSVEVDERGPDEVRVDFESGGEDEQETRVRGTCRGGVPRLVAEERR